MFGFIFKKKPKNALEEFIFSVYGNPPPPKRADTAQAAELVVNELFGGMIKLEPVRKKASELFAGPIPYSTHDLAIAVALHIYKLSKGDSRFAATQIQARVTALGWYKEGLIVQPLFKTFEDTLYELFRPS